MKEELFIKALELYEKGYTGPTLAKELDFNVHAFYKALKKRKIKAKPKGTGHKHSKQTKEKISISMSGEKNPNFGKFEEWMEIGLEIGQRRERTESEKENLSLKAKERWINGVYDSNNYGGNAKIYLIENKKCKGLNEFKFVNKFKEEYPQILDKVDRIITPTGVYTPDYDFGNYFVELKSTHTYNVLIGLYDYKRKGVGSMKQLEKIKWTSENIKPVKIIIGFKSLFLSEEEYLKVIKHD